MPFFIPKKSKEGTATLLLWLRIIALLWMTILTFNTLTKRTNMREILTWLTFYDVGIESMQIGVQISVIVNEITFKAQFPASADDLLKDEIRS